MKKTTSQPTLSKYALDFLENSKGQIYEQNEDPQFDQNASETTSLEFGNGNKIPLYPVTEIQNFTLETLYQLNSNRKSSRDYSKKNFTFQKFSHLLSISYFLRARNPNAFNIPSGGALYPVDIYILNIGVEDLQKGLFYYNPYEKVLQNLQSLTDIEIKEVLNSGFRKEHRNDMTFENAAAIIFFGVDCTRTTIKYGDRGLRFTFIESGAILQNLYLTATALNIGICAIGWLMDDFLRNFLQFDNDEKIISLAVVIGNIE